MVFAPDDATPPAISSVVPADGSTSVPASTHVSATFNEPLRASSVTIASLRLRTAAGDVVPAAVTYDNRTAVLIPTAALVAGGLFTATVTGVEDAAGNPLPQPVSWSFTVAPASPGPDPGPTPGSEPNDRPVKTPSGAGGVEGSGASGGSTDRAAPRIQVGPRTAKVSRSGAMKLRVT